MLRPRVRGGAPGQGGRMLVRARVRLVIGGGDHHGCPRGLRMSRPGPGARSPAQRVQQADERREQHRPRPQRGQDRRCATADCGGLHPPHIARYGPRRRRS